MKKVIKKERKKASTIPTEEARGVALFDGKREEKRKGRGRYLEKESKGGEIAADGAQSRA